ncbi:MAG: transposase [Chromatiales bacterium]
MTEYRRAHVPGATWFFTVNLAERRGNRLLVDQIDALRRSFRYVTERRPFRLDAVVVLPDHLHCIWTLLPGDTDFSMRWNLLKGRFSHVIEKGERISQSREKRRERGLWQRRFWEHLLGPHKGRDPGNNDGSPYLIPRNPLRSFRATCYIRMRSIVQSLSLSLNNPTQENWIDPTFFREHTERDGSSSGTGADSARRHQDPRSIGGRGIRGHA